MPQQAVVIKLKETPSLSRDHYWVHGSLIPREVVADYDLIRNELRIFPDVYAHSQTSDYFTFMFTFDRGGKCTVRYTVVIPACAIEEAGTHLMRRR